MPLDLTAILDRAGRRNRAELLQLPINVIVVDPSNPRRSLDEDELDALAASIRSRGVLQPITVRPANTDGVYPLLLGARRLAAAAKAGLDTIPAILCADDAGMFGLVDQIIENDQRANLTTVELSDAVDRLIQAGHSHAAIARLLGRDRGTISLHAAVSGMPDCLKALLDLCSLRTVYDLYQHWRRDPAVVEAFLLRTPAEAINRAAVARIGRHTVPSPMTDEPRGLLRRQRDGDDAPPVAKVGLPLQGRVEVEADGVRGLLVFALASDGRVQIRQVDGSIVSVKIDRVRLVAVMAAGSTASLA